MSGLTFTDEQLKASGVFHFRQPPTYFWRPQEDITTLELAKCLPMFVAGTIRDYPAVEQCYDALPDNCKRHWEVKSA